MGIESEKVVADVVEDKPAAGRFAWRAKPGFMGTFAFRDRRSIM